ncbi:putative reverse transcriptase domain-containing protein [Tanacetum coccineum]|uniref:Reverse transcriptase domain-containing protein n=1 Tax=Tanacetum coccineum TaxID=301880 RepID=A0ABQ5C006_9ASTR
MPAVINDEVGRFREEKPGHLADEAGIGREESHYMGQSLTLNSLIQKRIAKLGKDRPTFVSTVHNNPRDQYVAARDAAPVPTTDDDDTATAKDSQPLVSRGSPRDPTMPLKRRSQTKPPPLLTQEAVNQLVQDGIEAAIRAKRERVREEATKDGGAVGLCRWFKKMESTFGISECAERRKVKFATATLHGRALTWWNSQVATLGLGVANGETTSSRPATLNEVVRMAHTLMEQKIQDKAERIAESNKRKWESNNNNYRNNNRGNYCDNDCHNQYNDRRQGGSRAMTTAQNNDVDQGGPAPNCNRCGLCHFGQCPSKCNRCRRRGHKANDYRKRTVAAGANARPIRACYECGDRNHSRNQCPNLANQRGGNATGRAYVMREAEKGHGPNVVAGKNEVLVVKGVVLKIGYRSGGLAGAQRATPVVENVHTWIYEMLVPRNFMGLKVLLGFVIGSKRWRVVTLRLEVAIGKPWTKVKYLMDDEFCPNEEVQEAVPNENKKVELYIKGLPEIIKGETTSSRPTMLNDVVRMAHTLMEQQFRQG